MSTRPSAWWQAQVIQKHALGEPLRQWRLALKLLLITQWPVVLLFVLVEYVTAFHFQLIFGDRFFGESGTVDPLLGQHIAWMLAQPEMLFAVLPVLSCLLWGWGLGLWLVAQTGETRLGISSALRLILLMALIVVVPWLATFVAVAVERFSELLSFFLDIAGQIAFYYVLFRCVPLVFAVVARRPLGLSAAFRQTAKRRGVCMWLAIDIYVIGLIVGTVMILIGLAWQNYMPDLLPEQVAIWLFWTDVSRFLVVVSFGQAYMWFVTFAVVTALAKPDATAVN